MAEVADDLSHIRAYNTQKGPRCTTGLLFSGMDPDLLDTVKRAIADPTIENKAIVRWLETEKAISISFYAFQRHARGECRCG